MREDDPALIGKLYDALEEDIAVQQARIRTGDKPTRQNANSILSKLYTGRRTLEEHSHLVTLRNRTRLWCAQCETTSACPTIREIAKYYKITVE